jgi:dTDP-4-amino-4,6-dideoxygalactose transaminase
MDAASRKSKPHRAVPLLDVGRANRALREQILEAITRVVDSGKFLFGPEVQAFEQQMADVCGTRHAIGCASGSDALLLALMALGIGPEDEVIVPSFTFFATASAVWRLGARPVFVDIDPRTFNLQPDLVEQAITAETRAIIPVHLFGQCAPMDVLCEIAASHGLYVVEDAAQAIGAHWRQRPAGAWGHIGCFSFYPTKNLGGFGDGGMLTTSDDQLADKLRLLACHGMRPRYYHHEVGINSRLDTIQAAVLAVKLQHLAEFTRQRELNAARYKELFARHALENWLALPESDTHGRHVWNQYTIRVPARSRDALRASLTEQHIGTEIYYPVPLHRQDCFRCLGYAQGSLPQTERLASEVLSLPIFPEMSAEEQDYVVAQISAFRSVQRRAA